MLPRIPARSRDGEMAAGHGVLHCPFAAIWCSSSPAAAIPVAARHMPLTLPPTLPLTLPPPLPAACRHRELSDLVKEVQPAARRPQARISFAFVYPDRRGKNVMRQVGCGCVGWVGGPVVMCGWMETCSVCGRGWRPGDMWAVLDEYGGRWVLVPLRHTLFPHNSHRAWCGASLTLMHAACCLHVLPPSVVQVGLVHSTRLGEDDSKSLKQLNFQTGDFMSVAIY